MPPNSREVYAADAMATRIYTRTGDHGETGLYGGERVSKAHPRVEACGAIDELNAALGWVLAAGAQGPHAAIISEVQALLFELGAELATPEADKRRSQGVGGADVARLEREIDVAEAELAPLKTFILPGGCELAARLHLARAGCRRAERRTVSLREHDASVPILTVVFLNRLGDLLFVLARQANARAGQADVVWRPR